MSPKSAAGNFFEDFQVGQVISHATPRTVTAGDVALYAALFGSRFALNCAEPFAETLGLRAAPIDNWLVFHMVFGKTVPDISLNAVANLGYADVRFLAAVYPGDTLHCVSEVIGVKQNSNGKTGVVYVRTRGINQHNIDVLTYVRWVMVRKRDPNHPEPAAVVPDLPGRIDPALLAPPVGLDCRAYDWTAAGSEFAWQDYSVGEKIDHVDGVTIEEAEHMIATRLYQNTARVHFNQFEEGKGRFGRRLIYGGHIISLARALSFNGLANGIWIAGMNGGAHTAPAFAGDTVFAWSEILERAEIAARSDLAALRIRTIAAKDRPCADFPHLDDAGKRLGEVILEIDYWVLIPRR